MKIGIRNDGTQMTQILRTTADFIFGCGITSPAPAGHPLVEGDEKKESATIRPICVIRVPFHQPLIIEH